ncbi:MAG TPA: hypothetical protein VF219_07790 [Vicinamibacterales bacterium]
MLATMTVSGIVMTATLAAAQSSTPSGTSDTDGWKTVIYPIHAWLPVFGADVTLPGQPTPPGTGGGGSGGVTIPSAKTSGTFNGAALAGARVERARVSIEGQFLWAGMSGSVETPLFNLKVNTIASKVMGGFEVAPALYVDGGVRRFALDMTASILDFQPVTWKPGIVGRRMGLAVSQGRRHDSDQGRASLADAERAAAEARHSVLEPFFGATDE